MVKWNDSEVLGHLRTRTPDWEGRLSYKGPPSGTFSMTHNFKERYFKLYGNILVCFKADKDECTHTLIMENYTVKVDDREIFTFSLNFDIPEGTEKHVFVAVSMRSMNQWVEALHTASYEKKRLELILLQIKIRSKTGEDPLAGTNFEYNPVYSLSRGDAAPPVTPKEKRKCDCSTNGDSVKSGEEAVSNFTSHIGIQVWEDKPVLRNPCVHCEKTVAPPKPTFKSHLKEDLIQF